VKAIPSALICAKSPHLQFIVQQVFSNHISRRPRTVMRVPHSLVVNTVGCSASLRSAKSASRDLRTDDWDQIRCQEVKSAYLVQTNLVVVDRC
jgi:hypothetical protein